MREYFSRQQDAKRVGRKDKLLQSAVGVISGKQARQSQHRSQQRCDPDDTWSDRAQQSRLGADAQRKQAHHNSEEKQRIRRVGLVAHYDKQFAGHYTTHRREHRPDHGLSSML